MKRWVPFSFCPMGIPPRGHLGGEPLGIGGGGPASQCVGPMLDKVVSLHHPMVDGWRSFTPSLKG